MIQLAPNAIYVDVASALHDETEEIRRVRDRRIEYWTKVCEACPGAVNGFGCVAAIKRNWVAKQGVTDNV